jgi:hypothetical protein
MKSGLKLGGSAERTYIFIIPFRASSPHEIRKEQIKKCIDSIVSCFTKYNKKFQIIIVEQNNEHPFNMAYLKNIGFLEGEKTYNTLKVYLHINADYYIDTAKEFPKELDDFNGEGVLDIYSVDKDDKSHFVGGCCCFNAESFIKINGFPNNLFGYGGCDIAFRCRLDTNGVKYIRNTLINNGWVVEEHSTPRNISKMEGNVEEAKKACNDLTSGLNTSKYTVDGPGELNKESQHVNHILVNFSYP